MRSDGLELATFSGTKAGALPTRLPALLDELVSGTCFQPGTFAFMVRSVGLELATFQVQRPAPDQLVYQCALVVG